MNNYITITSKLTKNQTAKLRRRAKKSELFMHVGRSKYMVFTPDDDNERGSMDTHTIARRMMTIAGATFTYELS